MTRLHRVTTTTSPADSAASRWIVIDPAVQGGHPTIVGTRITVSILAERFAAGDSVRLLAEDYDLETEAVEEALRYHLFKKEK